MGLSHFEREEETLVNYFKQMLNESYDLDGDIAPQEFPPEEGPAASVSAAVDEEVRAEESNESSAEDIIQNEEQTLQSAPDESDGSGSAEGEPALEMQESSADEDNTDEGVSLTSAEAEDTSDATAAAVTEEGFGEDSFSQDNELPQDSPSETVEPEAKEDLYQTGNSVMEPMLQKQEEPEHRTESLPFAEQQSIASLLEAVPSEQTRVETVETAVETEEVTEVVAEVVEPKIETATQAVVKISTQAPVVVEAKTTVPGDEHLEWENINMPDEFQALFFLARGVRFAVPLVDLGGIFEVNHLTPLFGRPAWYKGVADIRGKKLNVVDTLRWVKPEVTEDSDFNYIIVLGESLWAISCDKLEGNRYLNKENVKWRQHAGNRPWLAGIVKKEMCALLHVNALISMFNKGFDLTDLK